MARSSVLDKLEDARVRAEAIKALRADVEVIENDKEAGEWVDAAKVAKECYGDKIDLSTKEFAEVVDSFNAHYYSIGGIMMPLEYVLAKSRIFKTVTEYFVGQRSARGFSQSWADNLGSYAFGQWKANITQGDNDAKREILFFETHPIFEEASALDQNRGPPGICESHLRMRRLALKQNEGNIEKAFEDLQRIAADAEVGNCDYAISTAYEVENEIVQQSLPPKINIGGFKLVNYGLRKVTPVNYNRRDRAENSKVTRRAFSPLREDSMASLKGEQAIKSLRLELPGIKSDREAKKWLIGSSVTKQFFGKLAIMSLKRFVEIVQCFQEFDASSCLAPMPLAYVVAVSNVCMQDLKQTRFDPKPLSLVDIAFRTWKSGFDKDESEDGMDNTCLFFLKNRIFKQGVYLYGATGPPLISKKTYALWKDGEKRKEFLNLIWSWGSTDVSEIGDSDSARSDQGKQRTFQLDDLVESREQTVSPAPQPLQNALIRPSLIKSNYPLTPKASPSKRTACAIEIPISCPEKRLKLEDALVAELAKDVVEPESSPETQSHYASTLALLTECQKEQYQSAVVEAENLAELDKERVIRKQLRSEKRLREAEARRKQAEEEERIRREKEKVDAGFAKVLGVLTEKNKAAALLAEWEENMRVYSKEKFGDEWGFEDESIDHNHSYDEVKFVNYKEAKAKDPAEAFDGEVYRSTRHSAPPQEPFSYENCPRTPVTPPVITKY